jgi:hypothetical protein
MEAASGFEPLNGGFADLSLSHLGTPPHPFAGLKHRLCEGSSLIPVYQFEFRSWPNPCPAELYGAIP